MICVQLEVQSRKLFLWKIGVHDQKEKVFEMRRCNEALVTNMLPEHVAKHFLGTKKRDEVGYIIINTHAYILVHKNDKVTHVTVINCTLAPSCGFIKSNLRCVFWREY